MVRSISSLFVILAVVSTAVITGHLSHAQTTPTPTPNNLPAVFDWKYNPENGHYYAYNQTESSWEEAKLYAEKINGHLVTITDENENNWILVTFISVINQHVWIGLEKQNDTWQWVTDESYNYTYWLTEYTSGWPLFNIKEKKWTSTKISHLLHSIIEIESPLPTPTPIIPQTPTPTPEQWSSLNGDTLEENQLWADAPAGFTKGKIQAVEIPAGQGSDGKGLEIKLAPGQGAWILGSKEFDMETLAHVSGYFRLSNKNGAVALAALNSPIDGQFGYTNIVGEEIPVDDYRQFNLIYGAPSGKIQFAIQAVNYPYSTVSTTVWIDNLNVVPFDPVVTGEAVKLQVNGNFEDGLEDLIVNINEQDGNIVPFFQSLTDIALRLSIEPQHTAANIGTTCEGIYESFPMRLLGQVSVQRDSLPGGGMMGFVLTNGYQNLGVFRFADEIPDVNAPQPENLIIGGDFTANNPNIPISAFVQAGGPNAEYSVVVDDLMVVRQ